MRLSLLVGMQRTVVGGTRDKTGGLKRGKKQKICSCKNKGDNNVPSEKLVRIYARIKFLFLEGGQC